MDKLTATHQLHGFFLAMARRSFSELGISDATVVRYVATLMTDFARSDRVRAISSRPAMFNPATTAAAGKRLTGQDRQSLVRTRELRKHIGDYALFMSGLFRTHIETNGALGRYLDEGRRAYGIVSELDLTLLRTGFWLFQELSDNFELYSGALDYMRKAYFAPSADRSSFAEFLERVDGWIVSGISTN